MLPYLGRINKMSSCSNSEIQTSSSNFCSDGVYCSVSGNTHNEVMVVYHKNLMKKSMFCRLGTTISTNEVVFRDIEEELDQCEGEGPQVAINDERMMVIAFSTKPSAFASSASGVIKYTVGKYKEDRKPTNWERDHTVCDGTSPVIAMYEDHLVLVFIKNNSLIYKTGILNYSTRMIYWEERETLIDKDARQPRVAMNSQWCCVVYKGQRGSSLKTILGKVQLKPGSHNYEIQFEIPTDSHPNSPEGNYPSITLLRDNTVLVVYQRGEAAFRKLFASTGEIDTTKKVIKWPADKNPSFVPGALSSLTTVGSEGSKFVEVHTTNKLGGCKLWYEVGTVKTL